MNFNPDPDKVIEAMEKLTEAFERAAAADTGAHQPLFQQLSDTFNEVTERAMDMGASQMPPEVILQQLTPVILQMQFAVEQIKSVARSNPAIADTLQTLESDIQDAMSGLIPGLGKAPKKPQPPKPPKPPRRGGGQTF